VSRNDVKSISSEWIEDLRRGRGDCVARSGDEERGWGVAQSLDTAARVSEG
jgi:hypothetical protein